MPDKTLDSPTLNIVIRSRSKTYFEGKGQHLTSKNDTGVFDILPYHANFITVIKDFVEVKVSETEVKKFEVKGGVLRVMEDKVNIYLTL